MRFLIAFSRLNLLGTKYFHYGHVSIEQQMAAIAEQVAAGSITVAG